jgi:hypothetical protein
MLYLVNCGLTFTEAACGLEIASIHEGHASSSFYLFGVCRRGSRLASLELAMGEE